MKGGAKEKVLEEVVTVGNAGTYYTQFDKSMNINQIETT